jgi:S1-C subfamily serine protease
VVAPNRVMSMAHVVAGTDSVSVEVDGTRYDAQVVSYDPNRDISILDVPNLRAEPLLLAEGVADSGSDALMLGYPGGGDFVATPVRIREVVELNGPDIYRTTTATREVYTIRGFVRQGDSGGPIIDLDGKALGVAFGAAVDDPDTGFVLTVREVAPQLAKVGNTVPGYGTSAKNCAPSTTTSTAPTGRSGQPSTRESCLTRCPLLHTGRARAASGSMCEITPRTTPIGSNEALYGRTDTKAPMVYSSMVHVAGGEGGSTP